jgi:thiol-disulfide isomerase/thioredoxin
MHVRYIKEGEEQIKKLFEVKPYVAVVFYADWCPPCDIVAVLLKRNAIRSKLFVVAIVDVDLQKNIALGTKLKVNN